jgi:hypothetical protein
MQLLHLAGYIKEFIYALQGSYDHLHVQESKSDLQHSQCDDSPWLYSLKTLHLLAIQVHKGA